MTVNLQKPMVRAALPSYIGAPQVVLDSLRLCVSDTPTSHPQPEAKDLNF